MQTKMFFSTSIQYLFISDSVCLRPSFSLRAPHPDPDPGFSKQKGNMLHNISIPSSSSSLFLKQTQRCSNPVLACVASQDSFSRKEDSHIHGLSEMIVGVLGGGQLGRMLCQVASQMNCPASSLAYDHMVGSFDDSATVQEFAKRCGVLTVEIEHVDVATLEKLEGLGVDCQPKASTLRIIQDKYIQKVHFAKQGIPLPDFMQIDDLEAAKKAAELFGYPVMVKSKRLAYDGRGNSVANSEEELSSAISSLGGFNRGLYVEKWAPFVKELAVIVARGRDSSISCYPVVETIHKQNICHIVKAPADVPWKIRKLATDVAQKAVSSLEGAGVFAVELFLTRDNQILLNEVAPRPHNSGHHTIESCYTSQYEQHLRAVVGLPLGDPSMKTSAALMYNLLGEDELVFMLSGEAGFQLAHKLITRALNLQGLVSIEMRKQRKMGHITIVGSSMAIVLTRLNSMLKEEASESEPTITPRVGIIMGSDSDLPVMKDAAKVLDMFGVPYEVRIVSAHRTPETMFSYALSAQIEAFRLSLLVQVVQLICQASMVASLTPLPVIGVPVRGSSLDGMDSLMSIVQMPRGVPVATVAINNATNAGLLAVRMLGAGDADLLARMSQYQEDTRDEVLRKAEKLQADGWGSYLNP
ncbi:hypothetical protein K2173_008851 [Erythroxylum novogranatense]|uniref:phosphoribosylaminoimidazole carboxylase n=1 Tax=Erythroxylum novogranatense TaxID=1862640 RepID=A0AAV8U9B5_9ROSI|nr:hypothetical protein K2173_008851 [Erythroxylum novogranatense]